MRSPRKIGSTVAKTLEIQLYLHAAVLLGVGGFTQV